MIKTFSCYLKKNNMIMFCDQKNKKILSLSEVESLISRRQRSKLSFSNRLAGSLWKYFNLSEHLEQQGGDPYNTPLLILNRYANWDYVSEIMCKDPNVMLQGVTNYIATAWFPSSLQGYLTIEYNNRAEALTLATTDIDIQTASVNELFLKNSFGQKYGNLIIGTFECLPKYIGTNSLEIKRTIAFGAFSLISSQSTKSEIIKTLSFHQELYDYVK
ncbi:hypothetical protein [Bartonella pachyuromydis]|uniref:Uncharacterized protein n=1 Tax=Bartonella pachyuromydis TaxID=931097 RepID=A0ABP8VM88_9HYPH